MKRVFSIVGALMLLTAAGSAHATALLDLDDMLALSDSTQLGRLSRSGIPSDWSVAKAFPGVLNTSTSYHYKTYLVDPGIANFIQIDIFENNNTANMFVSAYDTAYLPNSAGSPNFGFNTNYLGDAGFSGNPLPNDPNFFQVLVPLGHKLLVVVNDTVSANGGIGTPFHLTVEGFIDSEFTDPPVAAVPEPATMLLTASGLAFVVRRRRRRT
jgi:hypothetical protein